MNTNEDDLLHMAATDLAQQISMRKISPVEVLQAFVARIEARNGELNALVTLDLDGARVAAEDAARRAGSSGAPRFLGVPIAIKDLHATRGMRTTYGTTGMAHHVPHVDDADVARIRRAGFVIIGKSNTCELGTEPITESRLLGPCRSPWSLRHTSGGSSGGAAAAVAAGLLPVAHGSDSGGSLRIPASCCGVVGLKPARGRITNAPRMGEWVAGLGTTGPIGRYVRDVAALLDVMQGPAPGDPYGAAAPERSYEFESGQEPGRLRVGLTLSSPIADVDPQIVRATESAAQLLADLGHQVEPFEPPISRSLFRHFATLWTANIAAQDVAAEEMEDFNAGLAAMGRETDAPDLLRAITAMQLASRELVVASSRFDVVLSPTLAQPPVEVGVWEGWETRRRFAAGGRFTGFTAVANITGQPAISIPQGTTNDGLPIGVMFTGRPEDEATLIRLASQMEQVVGWPSWRPSDAQTDEEPT